jgi:hypothetical protein
MTRPLQTLLKIAMNLRLMNHEDLNEQNNHFLSTLLPSDVHSKVLNLSTGISTSLLLTITCLFQGSLGTSDTDTDTEQSELKLYKTVVRPVVLYASKTWVLKEAKIKKLMIFERKILRRIFGPTKEKDGT